MKPLYYKETKPINGSKRAVISISLDDSCKNGFCEFHVRRFYEKLVFGEWKAIYTTKKPLFKEYADIIEMDGKNSEGMPSYPEGNGIFWLKEDLKNGARYLDISEEVASKLCLSDRDYFKYQLFTFGIVSDWREKAKKAISHLENLCGQSFVDYDAPRQMTLTDEEIATISARIADGYYNEETIKERERKAEEEKRAKERENIINRYDAEIKSAHLTKEIMLAVFDYFGTTDNVIFYYNAHELCFNWQNSYGCASLHRQYTEKEIVQFRRECGAVGLYSIALTMQDGQTRRAV